MSKDFVSKYPAQIVVDGFRLIGYTISKALWFVRYVGLENIPPNDSLPFLIIANHQTYVDPVWVCLPLRRRIRYMAFAPAFKWPVVGPLIRYLGAFPVAHDAKSAVGAMKQAVTTLKEGSVLTIFPEGAREFADGKLLEFKPGAARIAAEANVPVLPVTIIGGNRIWPQKQKYPFLFRRVTVKYHPLMTCQSEPASQDRQNSKDWTEQIRLVIESSVENLGPKVSD